MACEDALTCTSCVQGHYLENYECHLCKDKWPNCVDCIYTENYDLLVKKNVTISTMQTLGFTTVTQLIGWYESNQAAVASDEAFASSLITDS